MKFDVEIFYLCLLQNTTYSFFVMGNTSVMDVQSCDFGL
jgi:hypothetical protein